MPWQCNVCTLLNADDEGTICDLCGEKKGTPDPDKGKRKSDKHISWRTMLREGPDAYQKEISEKRRMDALKEIKGVFGVPLTTPAPRLLCDCIAYLRHHGMNTEGLFRIPGQQDIVDELRDSFESDENADVLSTHNCGVNEVATLMKSYFRALPTPLVADDNYVQMLGAVRRKHAKKEDMVQAVNDVTYAMPSPQRECLGMLIEFLREVTQFSSVNKMNAANLATCFAPSLLRAPDSSSPQEALMDMSSAIAALNVLIKENGEIPTPSAQEIRQNTTYRPKGKAPRPAVPPRAPPGQGMGQRGAPPGMGSKMNPPPGMGYKN